VHFALNGRSYCARFRFVLKARSRVFNNIVASFVSFRVNLGSRFSRRGNALLPTLTPQDFPAPAHDNMSIQMTTLLAYNGWQGLSSEKCAVCSADLRFKVRGSCQRQNQDPQTVESRSAICAAGFDRKNRGPWKAGPRYLLVTNPQAVSFRAERGICIGFFAPSGSRPRRALRPRGRIGRNNSKPTVA